ncbi:MAG: TonB-dependent receptor [Gammaproteobacteria bacterium]|nr:TonB-dependent receptor [Gammaproteobacteria bacterium]
MLLARPGFVASMAFVAALTATGGQAATGDAPAPSSDTLAEVIITAERHASTIQETPVSISAVTGEQLLSEGITSVEDITREVPGLSMRTAGPGQSEYEARGLASNGGNAPTVGFYLGDVPLSPPALAQIGKVVIDPNLYDLDRVEILRGPQGTLYGSSSMGGTIRLVLPEPQLHKFSGSADVVGSGTDGGGGNGAANAMVNLPLGEVAAVRIVGSDEYRSGWISRTVLNPFPVDTAAGRGDVTAAPVQSTAHDVNNERLLSGRADLLVRLGDSFSVDLLALGQHMTMGGYDEYDVPPGSADLTHYEAYPFAESVDDRVSLFSLTLKATLPYFDITSATGYWNRAETQWQDASESTSQFVVGAFPAGSNVPPILYFPYRETDTSHQVSEELRFTSNNSDQLHWVAGAFYSRLRSIWMEYTANPLVATLTPPGVNPDGIVFAAHNPYDLEQSALFADGSYAFTDAWHAEAGLRYFRYQTQAHNNEWGYYGFPNTYAPNPNPPANSASASGLNPRVDLSYLPTKDLTVYGSIAKGFRPGGANMAVPPLLCGASPASFDPDTVWDYELGEKARLADGRVRLNADVYYIHWNNVQQTALLPCGYQYMTNAGTGRSYGPELELEARLSRNWLVSLGGTISNSYITSPTAGYIAGLKLAGYSFSTCASASDCSIPILNVPKEMANAALEFEMPALSGRITARLTDSYVGSSYDTAFSVVSLPSYNVANFRVGYHSEGSRWSGALFVDNLGNKEPWISANNTSFQFNIAQLIRVSTLQPRTVGAQLDMRF